MNYFAYPLYSLLFLGLFLVMAYLRPDTVRQIKSALLFGIIAGPLSGLIYFRDYWQPKSLFGTGVPSIEDSLFGLSFVGISLLLYPLLTNTKFILQPSNKRTLAMYASVGLFLNLLCMFVLNMNSVIATSFAAIILTIYIITIRTDLIKPAVMTAALSVLYASIFYLIFLGIFFPNILQDSWLLYGEPLDITLFGSIPLTELLWFGTMAPCLLVLFLHVHNGTIKACHENSSA